MGSVGKSADPLTPRGDGEALSLEVDDPMPPRKASSEFLRQPYPKPTQVGEESILRREVTLVKELGKLTP